jgi:membrane-associated phospholipid phosphatase
MAKTIKYLIINLVFFSNGLFLKSNAQNFDINVLKQTNLNRNKNLDNFFINTSQIMPYVGSFTPVVMYTIGALTKNKGVQKNAIEASISVGVNALSTYIIKHSINRPRPVISYPYLTPLESRAKWSFPSGHTSNAFNIATTLSLQYKKWYYILLYYGFPYCV